MFAKCGLKCGCLVIAVFALSLTVIYASHICGLCPAGFFKQGCFNDSAPICIKCSPCLGRNNIVLNKCNATHDTVCRCKDGYFLDKKTSQCSRCSKCVGKNNIVVRKCHGTHNTVCRCREGYYFDTGVLYCTRCHHCKRGQGVVKNCTRRANTLCAKCVKGLTFSPKRSKTESCRACKICAENEKMVKECTRRKDTMCKAIPKDKMKEYKLKNKSRWPEPFNEKTTRRSKTAAGTTEAVDTTTKADIDVPTSYVGASKGKSRKKASQFTIVEMVLMGVGGLLFLALVFSVMFVIRWKRNKTTTTDTTTVVKTAPPSYPHHVHTPKPGRDEVNRLSKTPLMTGSTELLRNANFSIIEELSTCLNPKGRWKSLAARLGFSSKNIENFDIEPTQATERMLSEWSHQKDSTVHRLYDVLVAMKWSHEADIVYKHLNSP